METFKFHEQTCGEPPVKEKVTRIVAPKVVAVVQAFLRVLSSTPNYSHFKSLLKDVSGYGEKVNILHTVDLCTLKQHFESISQERDFFKNGIRHLKFFAFQLGQTLALIGD